MKNLFKISALSLGMTFTGAVSAVDLCGVTYQVQSNWGSGAQLQVSVTNNGASISNPTFSWNYAGSEGLVSFWNATSVSQSGKTFTVVDSGTVSTGGSFDFNLIINNPGLAPSDFLLNGVSCKTIVGATSSMSSSVQVASSIKSSSKSSVPSSSSSVATTNTASWLLDSATSMLNMVTVKKEHVAEIGTFSKLNGSVDKNGLAVLQVDLNTVDTLNTTRDSRIREFLFETSLLPTLYYSVQLDLAEINALPAGNSIVQTLNGSLTLHGVSAATSAQVLVTKTNSGKISVASYKPVLINAPLFDLKGGIEYIRSLVSPVPSSIGHTVPIYFNLNFSANSNATVAALTIPSTPSTPLNLNAVNNASGMVTLTWADSSNNETGFLVRRKDNNGYWNKIQSLSSNQIMLEDLLSGVGTYDYKVIALNGSVPSAPTSVVTVVVDSISEDPVRVGKSHYQAMCTGCHGADAKGLGGAFPPLNLKREGALRDSMINTIIATMPKGAAGTCDRKCAENIVAYLEATFWTEPLPPYNEEISCTAPINYGARQLRFLTRDEYQNTINSLLGSGFTVDSLPGDATLGHFISNTQRVMNSGAYEQYLLTAEKVAKWSADRNFSGVVSCNNNFNQDCANKLINEFAPKAFRRPLDSQEKITYTAMANGSKTNGDVKAGMKLALEGMLSSPQFLYRHEVGEKNPTNTALASDGYQLTPYEMATWLAYTYTNTTPDAQLLSKAASGALAQESEIRSEISRLIGSSAFKEKLGTFVNNWLATDSLNNVAKDPATYPSLNFSALIPHMQQELSIFFSDLMLDPNGKFETLYNADYTYVNEPLARHYGINGVSGNQFVRVATTNRGGILANGGFMARWADAIEPSPIRRAVRVRGRMLCQDVQDPPANVGIGREQLLEIHKEELANPMTTNKRRFELVTSLETCRTCHEYIINPLGFGLEDFDSVGNPRTIDTKGNTVNATGTLYAPQAWSNNYASTAYPFVGAKALGDTLATLPTAQRCLPQNLFRYSTGIGVEDGWQQHGDYVLVDEAEIKAYACDVQDLKHTMMEQSPRKMLEQLGTLDTVRFRKAWARPTNM